MTFEVLAEVSAVCHAVELLDTLDDIVSCCSYCSTDIGGDFDVSSVLEAHAYDVARPGQTRAEQYT